MDLYSISDGDDGTWGDGPIDTVTNTDTNTGFLIGENVANIVGIALDRGTVRATIDASYYFKGEKEAVGAVASQDGWENKYILQDEARRGAVYTANATVSVKEYSIGLKWDDKDQTKIASWTIEKVGSGVSKLVTTGSGKNEKSATAASVSINIPEPKAGETYKITAKSVTGATATSTVTFAAPTTEVAIVRELKYGNITRFEAEVKGKTKTNEAVLTIGMDPSLTMVPVINLGTAEKKVNDTDKTKWVVAGTSNAEQVTYTVNKKGIVTIDKDGKVYAVKRGVVTITAKTPTGKIHVKQFIRIIRNTKKHL